MYVSFDWSIYHGCMVVIGFAMVIRERPQCMTKIYKKNSDVLLTAKAFNGRVILEWLCDETYRFSQQEEAEAFDSRVYHIAAALNHDCYIAFPFFCYIELMLFELLTCVTSCMHIRVHDVWKLISQITAQYAIPALRSPHGARKHMSRFLGQLEQAGRYLNPGVQKYLYRLLDRSDRLI